MAASTDKGSTDGKFLGATWDALLLISTMTTLGVIACAVYGFFFSVKGSILALLAAALGFAIGGLAGFMFGFPRYTDGSSIANVDDLKKATETGRRPKSDSGLAANTNLERIVDWLTTMIIGATLVNLQQLVSWSTERLRALTLAIAGTGDQPVGEPSAVPGTLLIVPFMIAGFLHLYLWARRYLLEDWTKADQISNAVKTAVSEQTQQIKQDLDRLNTTVYRVPASKIGKIRTTLAGAGVDEATIANIETRYKTAGTWDDEPLKEFGPAEADGFRFTASVRDMRPEQVANSFEMTLTVTGPEGAAGKVNVYFLLHNTYDDPLVHAEFANGSASEVIYGEDAFVCGAIVVKLSDADEAGRKTTCLSLDLAKIPGVPDDFIAA